jgi:hypothetical protein
VDGRRANTKARRPACKGIEKGMEGSAFPGSNEQDDEQVATALDTASALWARGDAREALRWLRRAAEMAGEAGDDWRAVQLARAAADLANELQIPPTLVPASPGPLTPRSHPSHPPPAAMPPPSQPNHAPPVSVGPRSQAAHTAPAPVSARAPLSYGRTASPTPTPAPPVSVQHRPPAPSARGARTDVVTSAPPIGPEAVARPHASATSPRPRQALHVAVAPSEQDKNLLHVRILAEGEAVPAGFHGALLVALEPQTNLLLRRR